MARPNPFVRLLAATFCVAILLASTALAGDAILKVIPKDSIGFVVVNSMEKADKVCTDLTNAVQVPIPTPSMLLKQATTLDEGLDKKGEMAIVFYKGKSENQGQPPVFALFPVNDYKKFLSQFEAEDVTDAIKKVVIGGNDVLIASKGKYAVVVKETQQEALESFLASKTDVSGEMKSWSTWADEKIAYGVLTNHGIQETLKEGIAMLEGTLETFEQFQETNPQIDQIKKSLGLYLVLMKGIRENASQIGIGVSTVDKGAVKISARCDAKPDSDLANILDETKALSTDPMSVLPGGSFVLAGGGPIPQKAMTMLMAFSQEMNSAQLGLDEKQNEKMLKTSIEAVKTVVGQSFVFSAPTSEEGTMLDGAYGVIWTTDADAYMTAYKKQTEMTAEMLKGDKEVPMKITVEETTIDGYKTMVAKVDLSGMLTAPETAPVAEMMKTFFGEEMKITAYQAKVSDTLIVTAMNGETQLKKAIAVVKSKKGTLAEDDGVKKVTAMLPGDAQWYGYWSPSGTVELANWVIAKLPAQLKENMPFEKLPPFPTCPPMGVSAKVGKGTIEKTILLPPDTIRGMTMYIMQLQMMGPH